MVPISINDSGSHVKSVADVFGDKALAYHQYARVQKKAAAFLVDLISDLLPQLDEPYLEYGAGTGFVTQQLVEHLSSGNLFVTDLSAEMLNVCRENLTIPEGLNIIFESRDAENDTSKGKYGLIVTALTAQWFENTHDCLTNMLNNLKPGGILAYSYLDERCFPEWKVLCDETEVIYTGNPLPPASPIPIDTHLYCWEYSTFEMMSESYESPAAFFRNLKRIGASTQRSGSKNQPGAIQLLDDHWKSKQVDAFTISYGITFGVIRRKSVIQ